MGSTPLLAFRDTLEVGVEGVSGSDNIAEGEVGCSDIFYLTVDLKRGKILVT